MEESKSIISEKSEPESQEKPLLSVHVDFWDHDETDARKTFYIFSIESICLILVLQLCLWMRKLSL